MAETLTIRPMLDADLPGVLDTMRVTMGETARLRFSPKRCRAVRAALIRVSPLTALDLVTWLSSPVAVDVFDIASWDLALSDLELL